MENRTAKVNRILEAFALTAKSNPYIVLDGGRTFFYPDVAKEALWVAAMLGKIKELGITGSEKMQALKGVVSLYNEYFLPAYVEWEKENNYDKL